MLHLDADWRVVSANPAAGALAGEPPDALRGRTVWEIWPWLRGTPTEAAWLRTAISGEPARVRHEQPGALPMVACAVPADDGAGLLVLLRRAFADDPPTASSRHTEFLSRLHAALVRHRDPAELARQVLSDLAWHLDVAAALVCELSPDGAYCTVQQEFHDGRPSLLGTYRSADYLSAEARAAVLAGRPLVVADVTVDPRTATHVDAYRRLGIPALAYQPLTTVEGVRGLLGVNARAPRVWRADEIDLLRDVGLRLFAALQRARADASVRESEERLRTLIEAVDEAYCLCELVMDDQGRPVDYRFIDANPRFEAVTGLADPVGHTAREIVPGLGPEWLERYARVALGGERLRFEAGSDAVGRWWEVFAMPMTPRGRFAILFRDVTDRRRAEQAVREREERLRLFIDHAPVALAMFDREMRYVRASRRWLAVFGLEGQDLTGRLHYDVFPDLPPQWREVHRRGLAGEVLWSDGDLFERADGRRQWVRWEVRPWHDAAGAIAGIVIFTEDITDRREAELALQASEARLRLAQQVARVGSWAIDFATGEHHVSPEWRAIHGLPPGAPPPTWEDVLSLVHPEDRARARTFLARVQEEGRERDEAIRIVRPDGAVRHLHLRGTVVRDRPAPPYRFVGVVRDVTEERIAEQRVQAAQRMETAGTIAGGVAHEANNQMTVVLGAASFLAAREDLPSDARDDLGDIIRAAERTSSICRQLLAFSRRQRLQPTVLGPDLVVRDMEPLLRRTLGVRNGLVLHLGAGEAAVHVDQGQLEQILINLVINARDAMPDGGTVTIASATVALDPPALQRWGLGVEPGGYWHLAVRDTGVGMDPATLGRAFEPFFTTKPVGLGTGLGLAVVQGVLRQSGGDVSAESAPGAGTTMHVFLPLAQEADAEAPRPMEWPARPGAGAVVWVIEDEERVRAIAARALARAGYVVRTAASGVEAMAALEGERPACVVIDVVMPGPQGPTVAEELRTRWPGVPVLLMSGYPQEPGSGGARPIEGPFIAKPFQPEELVRRVGALIAGG